MIPLGPFNGKSVGTTISPWVVTLDALEPFRVKGQEQRPVPSYLEDPERATYSISLHAELLVGEATTVLSTSRLESMYWNMRQMVAHTASAGSALRTGDIMATGTVSGPEEGALGCLLEISKGGKESVTLSDGSQRTFLQDGDIIRLTAVAGHEDSGVGFGDCTGRLVASRLG